MTDAPIEEQISQYESQLAEVEELLQASPEDASLLSLKSDLVELLAITRQQIPPVAAAASSSEAQPTTTPNALEKALEAAVETSIGISPSKEASSNVTQTDAKRAAPPPLANSADTTQESTTSTTTTASPNEPPRKKSKKLKEFEIPPHLVIHDTDTEAQKNKKRREIKTLKNKWRVKKKEIESERKQQSWQSFQKKKGKKKEKSIFSTSDGKVGVVRGDL